jgi:hypothetical protein
LTTNNLFLKEITMDSKTIKTIVASVAAILALLLISVLVATSNKTPVVVEDRDRQQIRRQFGF